MIFLTPKVGRLLHHEVLIDPLELSLQRRAVEIAIEKASGEVLAHLVRECSTTTEETHYGRRATKVSVKVVVLASDEFRKATQDAYERGRRDGVVHFDHLDATARAERAEEELKTARAAWRNIDDSMARRLEKAEIRVGKAEAELQACKELKGI